jgi:prepilin-type processing-associated H-X9-DG protein
MEQVGYAINAITGGPAGRPLNVITNANGTSNVMFAWDHSNGPTCGCQPTSPVVVVPCTPFTDPPNGLHYPGYRHGGLFNVVYCDGHTESKLVTDLTLPLFYVQ